MFDHLTITIPPVGSTVYVTPTTGRIEDVWEARIVGYRPDGGMNVVSTAFEESFVQRLTTAATVTRIHPANIPA